MFAIGDCAAVRGEIFAYIEPIRRQSETIAAKLCGETRPLDVKPPLVQVNTPGLWLGVYPPRGAGPGAPVPQPSADSERVDDLSGDRIVGFVLSGERAAQEMQPYRQLYG